MTLLTTNPHFIDQKLIHSVVEHLNEQNIVVLPTDTLYAFAVKLSNRKGIEELCKIVGKKPEKANLSILCNDLKHISDFTLQFSKSIYKILNRNLPGPFTFILNANNKVPKMFLNKRKTIGIRVPDHAFTLAVIEQINEPLVVASVHHPINKDEIINNPTEIQSLYHQYHLIIIDDGDLHSTGSAVVDCTGNEPVLIREGERELML